MREFITIFYLEDANIVVVELSKVGSHFCGAILHLFKVFYIGDKDPSKDNGEMP